MWHTSPRRAFKSLGYFIWWNAPRIYKRTFYFDWPLLRHNIKGSIAICQKCNLFVMSFMVNGVGVLQYDVTHICKLFFICFYLHKRFYVKSIQIFSALGYHRVKYRLPDHNRIPDFNTGYMFIMPYTSNYNVLGAF